MGFMHYNYMYYSHLNCICTNVDGNFMELLMDRYTNLTFGMQGYLETQV